MTPCRPQQLVEPRTKKEGKAWVGAIVSKAFDGVQYQGFVASVSLANPQNPALEPALFEIKYGDGDVEDVELDELLTIMQPSAAVRVKEELARQSTRKRTLSVSGRGDDTTPLPESTSIGAGAPGLSRKKQQPAESAGRAATADEASRLRPASTSADPAATPAVHQDGGVPPAQTELRKAGLAGHLDKILVENFMCHEKFEMSFGPHVTLVSGTNGSGKSAVMQALQACLGVNARKTGRATNLAAFIRNDCNEARLQVTLFNTGDDAFEKERFGDRIIFERKLTRGSGGWWRVLNHAGKLVHGVKPAEVLRVLGVNAANPLTIITQDMTRAFLLGSSDDKKRKYDMFMQGTMLDEIQSELAEAATHVTNSADKLQQLTAEYEANKKEEQELQARLEKLIQLDRLIVVCKSMDAVLVWTVVWQERAGVAVLKSKLEGQGPQAQRQQLEEQLEEAKASLEKVKEEEDAVIVALNQSNEAAKNATADLKRLKDNVKEGVSARRSLESQKAEMELVLQGFKEQKETVEKVLNEDKGEQAQRQRERIEELERSTDVLRQALQEATEGLMAARVQASALQESIKTRQQRQDTLRREAQSHHNQMQTYRQQILEHEASRNNRVLKFGGEPVVRLLAAIQQRQRQFQRMPIGPIGAFLGLKDSQWATAIQAAIGGHLGSFLVHTSADRELLSSLAQSVGLPYLTVIQYNFDMGPHQNLQRLNRLTVMDVLCVTDADKETVLTNFLIDQGRIEATALTQSFAEARNDMHSGRVQKAYSACGASFDCRGNSNDLNLYRGGPPTLGMEEAQVRQQLEDALGNAESSFQAAEQQLAAAASEVTGLKAELAQLLKQQTELGKRKTAAKNNLDAKQHELQQQQGLSQDSEGNEVDELATQIQDCQAKILNTQVDLDDLVARFQEAQEAEAEARRLFEQRRELNAQRGDATAAFSTELDKLARRKAKLEAVQSDVSGKLAALAARLEEWKQQLHRREEELEKMQQVAENIDSEEKGLKCMETVRQYQEERIRTGLANKRRRDSAAQVAPEEEDEAAVTQVLEKHMTPEKLEKEHARLEASISSAQQEAGGDRRELEKQHEAMQKRNAKLHARVQGARVMVSNMQRSLSTRQAKYMDLKDDVVRTSSNTFHRLMVRRQHLGQIHVDDERQELVLSVKVKGVIEQQTEAVTDLKQLSGGERSFTTIAFLMALGLHTESPFRCMDEFDVFMDAINRRVATETLLEFAYLDGHHQYIFLTPQDIQAVADAKKELELKLKHSIGASFLKTVTMRAARP